MKVLFDLVLKETSCPTLVVAEETRGSWVRVAPTDCSVGGTTRWLSLPPERQFGIRREDSMSVDVSSSYILFRVRAEVTHVSSQSLLLIMCYLCLVLYSCTMVHPPTYDFVVLVVSETWDPSAGLWWWIPERLRETLSQRYWPFIPSVLWVECLSTVPFRVHQTTYSLEVFSDRGPLTSSSQSTSRPTYVELLLYIDRSPRMVGDSDV